MPVTVPRGTKLPSPTLNRSAAGTAAAAGNLPAYSRAGYAADRGTCPPHRSADPGLTLARPGAPSRFDDHLGPPPLCGRGCQSPEYCRVWLSRCEPCTRRMALSGQFDCVTGRACCIAPALPSSRISSEERPSSASNVSESAPGGRDGDWMAPGVLVNRGAGAGWMTPSCSTNVPRARLCGWSGASMSESTGAKQTSLPSRSSHHSARVFCLKSAESRSR